MKIVTETMLSFCVEFETIDATDAPIWKDQIAATIKDRKRNMSPSPQ
jgi:hypothetical protein